MTVVPSGYALPANELFQTQPWATRAALRHIPVAGKRVHEPFAGGHKMADVLREAGAIVTTSDIATYDRRQDFIFDYLADDSTPPAGLDLGAVDITMSNPPYGARNTKAAKACRMALRRCSGVVAMLCTMKFDAGSTRVDLFRDNPRFFAKIVLLDRIQWFPGDEGTEDHAWFIWGCAGVKTYAPRIIYERNPEAVRAATERLA